MERVEQVIFVVSLSLIFLSVVNIFVSYNLYSEVSGNSFSDFFDSGDDSLNLESGEHSIGPSSASVTVVEYADFECPYCGAVVGTHQGLVNRFKSSDSSWSPAVPGLKEMASNGEIRFVFKHFPLSFHKNAQKAAEASECASEQGKFWEYHDKLFENQNDLSLTSLKQYASDLGLDTLKFNECLESGRMSEEVASDIKEGQSFGVRGTPAFVIDGQLVNGAQSFNVLKQLIDSIDE